MDVLLCGCERVKGEGWRRGVEGRGGLCFFLIFSSRSEKYGTKCSGNLGGAATVLDVHFAVPWSHAKCCRLRKRERGEREIGEREIGQGERERKHTVTCTIILRTGVHQTLFLNG